MQLNKYHIIIFILLIIVIILISFPSKNTKSINTYNKSIDSLSILLSLKEKELKEKDIKIDSLYKVKNSTYIKYENAIKDFNNGSIVDDDSIIRFISSKIYY